MRYRWLFAISLVLITTTAISGCGGKKDKLETTPSPYKEGNYPGTLKIGNPYDIDGRTYVPNHDPDYREEGMASWYGPGFHGRATANGERFDQFDLTAAHRTLPLPSMVRVTNLENNRTEILRVNDRGPFKKDRIIDLSKASAEKLGVIGKGTAHVRVEYLPAESKRMIAQLVRNNKLKANPDTLKILAMHDVLDEAVVVKAQPISPPVTTPVAAASLGLISSANAAEDASASLSKNAVSRRAPLAPVASRGLDVPDTDVTRNKMRMARVERPAAMPKAPLSYEQGGVVPSQMPVNTGVAPSTNPTARPAMPSTPVSAPPPAAVPAPAAAPPAPKNLQMLPEKGRDTPLYQPLDAPQMPVVPQAKKPTYEREPVVATTTNSVSPSGIFIQAGSFSQAANAQDFSQRLVSIGQTVIKPVEIAGRTWYRVQVGPLANMSTAHSAMRNLVGMGIKDAHVVKD